MQEQESTNMKETSCRSETKTLGRTSSSTRLHRRYTPRNRPVVTLILLVICVPTFLYHMLPSLTFAIEDLISSHLSSAPRPGSTFCTKEVGNAECCAIYLAAQPCTDECRKLYVDRETMTLTAQYDDCVDQCLVRYNGVCKVGGEHGS